jgi:hypothetical protein
VVQVVEVVEFRSTAVHIYVKKLLRNCTTCATCTTP